MSLRYYRCVPKIQKHMHTLRVDMYFGARAIVSHIFGKHTILDSNLKALHWEILSISKVMDGYINSLKTVIFHLNRIKLPYLQVEWVKQNSLVSLLKIRAVLMGQLTNPSQQILPLEKKMVRPNSCKKTQGYFFTSKQYFMQYNWS